MMKVDLIEYTGKGQPDPSRYAASMLLFTKNTRLNMTPDAFDNTYNWTEEKRLAELKYMANTIPSSWEFVDYTFLLQGVTRAFTHQLVRTRTASYAQQTMRVLDVSQGPGWDYLTGPSIQVDDDRTKIYDGAMKSIDQAYKSLILHGAAVEDARGVLPTNIKTNIVAKMNMRTLVEMVRKRRGSRTQGEYRDFLEAMGTAVRTVHPWIDLFIERDFDKAADDLEHEIKTMGLGYDKTMSLIKLLDQMRTMQ
jgi:flavin-dependent thymidylate synthase